MTAGTINRHGSWSQDAVVTTVDPIFVWLAPKFFGSVVQFDGEFIEHDIVDGGGRRIAPFVSPIGLGRATRERGYRTFQIKPAYIKLLDTVRPEQGFTRLPGEQYGGSLSPDERLARKVAQKIVTHREMVETRWEAMAAEALFTGKVTITSEDYPTSVVDFERDPNLDMSVGTVWSDANSDPMSDIQIMAERINDSSKGVVANTIITRSTVWDRLLKNNKFRDSLDRNKNLSSNQGQGFEATGLRSTDKAPVLRGVLGGQYQFWTYDGYFETDEGQSSAFVPANKVLVCSEAGVEGRRYHGAIFDMDAGMQPIELYVKSRQLWNPSGIEVLTQSSPMLGVRRPNASGVLTVG